LSRPRPCLVALIVTAGLSAIACGEAGRAPVRDRTSLAPRLGAGDVVVAEVDGVPIGAEAVRVEARAGGGDARQALLRLIEAEVLAGAALARGLGDDFEVKEAARAAAVRRLLHDGLEREAAPERIPDADYRALYDEHREAFDHDALVEVWHLVALFPQKEPTAAQREATRAALLPLAEAARAAPTDEAFAALAPKAASGPLQATLKAERFAVPRHGAVEEPFAAAAFALERPGATSGLVETRYGFHIIRLVRRVPARHVGLADARTELQDAALLRFRRRALDGWLRELTERTHLEVHAERLARQNESIAR
jgi:peptidyl-prolyl cis-trans isomerase C